MIREWSIYFSKSNEPFNFSKFHKVMLLKMCDATMLTKVILLVSICLSTSDCFFGINVLFVRYGQ